jgi:phage portal protein BeeE
MANVSFLSQTINPFLTKIETELLGKLISPAIAHKYKFQFDRRELYASDLSSKADYQTKTIASGIYTINDWRRYENMPAVKDGDRVLVSANLKSLDELLNPQASAQAPKPSEPAPANSKKDDNDEEDD